MTIEELVQTTLRQHAGQVVDNGLLARGAEARRLAQGLRTRRRVAGAAVTGLAIVAAATLIGTQSLDRADGPDPAGLDGRVVHVRESFAGRSLISSAETTGGRELTLKAGSARGSEWLIACARVGGDYSVHSSIDGVETYSSPCEERPALGDALRFRQPAAGSGFESELRLWVTRTDDGVRVSPASAVLAAAAYALPEPAETLAGVDVYPIEENFGADWEVLDTGQSAAGQRSLTLDVPLHEGASMLELLSSGTGEAEVRLAVDGRRVHTVPAVYVLGGRSIGDMLTGGQPHRVTVWIHGAVPGDARLGIVVRGRTSS